MQPKTRVTSIPGVRTFDLAPHPDARGHFAEVFRRSWAEEEFDCELQVNCSFSRTGVIRGLHYHLRQVDYWYLAAGRVTAVLVDLRPWSEGFRRVETLELLGDEPMGVWIPRGVAHGYAAREPSSLIYLVSRYFTGTDEYGVAYDDPDLAVQWGIEEPVVSGRDRSNPRMCQLDFDRIGSATGKSRGC